ncbi:MAG TPA: HEAT repeat domain-containing protein [Bacteroidales bacterium]
MECQYYKEQITLLLTDSLDQTQRRELEEHLANCADCQVEFQVSQKIWNLMGEVPKPVPSDTMAAGFKAILNHYKKEQEAKQGPLRDWITKLGELWHVQVQPRFALSLTMIVIGFVAGYFLTRSGQSTLSYNKQIESLSSQVSEMKQMMMLTLLQDPSASQRIKAVSYTDEIGKIDPKVTDALLTTLNEDPNVNVRLMTLEALVKYANDPKVREGLVQSLVRQDSPLMQSAIADVMVKLQEKSSVRYLRQLLHKKDLNQMVKTKIEQSIHKLI